MYLKWATTVKLNYKNASDNKDVIDVTNKLI